MLPALDTGSSSSRSESRGSEGWRGIEGAFEVGVGNEDGKDLLVLVSTCLNAARHMRAMEDCSYFEVTIRKMPTAKNPVNVVIGVATDEFAVAKQLPGWDKVSWGYHGKDGCKYHKRKRKGRPYGPLIGQGDVVGCGLLADGSSLYFTKNGVMRGVAFNLLDRQAANNNNKSTAKKPNTNNSVTPVVYPAIGASGAGVELGINLGSHPFRFDPFSSDSPDAMFDRFHFLPAEVLLYIFTPLVTDVQSCIRLASVCSHWRALLTQGFFDDQWKQWTLRKWPPIRARQDIDNWFDYFVYRLRIINRFKALKEANGSTSQSTFLDQPIVIENCEQWRGNCPALWQDLPPSDVKLSRTCNICSKQVLLCKTLEETSRYVSQGVRFGFYRAKGVTEVLPPTGLASKPCPQHSHTGDYRIALLGAGGDGKSATVSVFVYNSFPEYWEPTIEDSFRKQMFVDEKVVLLEVLDTPGQEEFSALRDQWIRSFEGFVVCYTISSRTSFEGVNAIIDHIHRGKDTTDVPMILCGMCCDRVDEREVEYEEGLELAKQFNISFIEVSAKLRLNLQELFIGMVRIMQHASVQSTKPTKVKGGKKRFFGILG